METSTDCILFTEVPFMGESATMNSKGLDREREIEDLDWGERSNMRTSLHGKKWTVWA